MSKVVETQPAVGSCCDVLNGLSLRDELGRPLHAVLIWPARAPPVLAKLLDAPVTYEAAPDLFCLDLYKEFDLDRLAALAKAK